ncbi:hypothetical protein [Desmospora activa]|uniref:Uncharacterized protein n=1 Tax=Desmospora activa DSM 45169 TaxID=1121389 RepID=A0A2T4Z7H5_9BACL|nr:hypothetical protein [Desmospora activa]PTM57848.1 hypothetical protein C8J48_0412 [Desmospora activa DSM 45169]
MIRPVISISLLSFGGGVAAQWFICALYISSMIEQIDGTLWLLLILYLSSETLLLAAILFFGFGVPIYSVILRWIHRDTPGIYPLLTVFIGLIMGVGMTWWNGHFDWLLFALLLPAAFLFGGLWWNRIVVDRETVFS